MTPEQWRAARAHLAEADPVLHAATAHLDPFTFRRPREPYRALLRAVVGQQLSTKAAASIWGRVEDHFGGHPTPEALLATEPATLRGLGLSWRKAEYLHHVAREAQTGNLAQEVVDALDDDEAVAHLTRIKGIGAWSVHMILMFGMGRPDVLPVGNLGIRQAMTSLYGLEGDRKEVVRAMVAHAEPWRPWRSAACRLLWAWKDA